MVFWGFPRYSGRLIGHFGWLLDFYFLVHFRTGHQHCIVDIKYVAQVLASSLASLHQVFLGFVQITNPKHVQ